MIASTSGSLMQWMTMSVDSRSSARTSRAWSAVATELSAMA
jgi:hypothetical protein